MRLNIRGKNLSVTPAIKEYIEKKLGKLEKYFQDGDNTTSNVVIKTRGNKDVIEVTILKGKATIRAEVMDDDLYTAIDLVTEKLEKQIKRNKERYNSLKQKQAKEYSDIFMEFEAASDALPELVKKKSLNLSKPMDINEAILEMEFVNHDFFIYKDSDTKNICVLYKRRDGNYGLIEIEKSA